MNTSTEYCLDHQKPICFKCKSDLHFECKVEHLVSPEELEYQVESLGYLLKTMKKSFTQFSLEDFYPQFEEIIESIQNEHEDLKQETLKEIQDKAFLKFAELEVKFNLLRKKIHEDYILKDLMSHIFQLTVLKDFDIEAIGLEVQEDDDPDYDERTTVDKDADSLKMVNSISKKENAEDSKIQVQSQIIKVLRPKYFQTCNPNKFLPCLQLNCLSPHHLNFMKECIAQKTKLIKIKKFCFFTDNSQIPLLKEYIDECIPEDFCETLIFDHSQNEDKAYFSNYSSCIEELLYNPPSTLEFKQYIFEKEDLEYLKSMIQESSLKITLANCWRTFSSSLTLFRLTKEDQCNYSLHHI
ncbi:unnamed protein product [Moneuplotes crassus]|uniref:Uncharacterized protein n=1 Tax=Euplotes crassus TaxID=5936 RepID=A0AAD2CX19_EUPCR|nr:unnamed protein product [Moneuplotes crassus]